MPYSRRSGRASEAERATWRARPGHPGGLQSIAQRMGLEVQPSRPEPVVDDAALQAFLTDDRAHFVRVLRLEPWHDDPCVLRPDRCTQGHPIAEPMPGYGCSDQHEAHVLRLQLIAEAERLGAFTWENLTHADEETSEAAWAGLVRAARAVGIRETTETEASDAGA
jgi:hypothetical protein